MLYFMRHAQSTANRDGVYAGHSAEALLTPEGRAKLRTFAMSNQQRFDKIYTSELIRSVESAQIFLEEQAWSAPTIADQRINELDFGSLTGKSYLKFDSEELYRKFNIEPKSAFYERVKSFYDDIRQEAEQSDVLIIGHAGTGKILYAIIHDIPYTDYNSVPDISSYAIHRLS